MSDEGDMSVQEYRHHKLTRRFIMVPVGVLAPEPDSGTTDPSRLSVPEGDISLSSLTPGHVRVRNLYNKDCVVYLGVPLSWSEREKLFEAMYFEWFPHRDREQDLERGSFFASFFSVMDLKDGPAQLARFHFESLCPKLKELQPDVLEKEPMHFESTFEKLRQKGLFRMRKSFGTTFLIVDRENWRDGVAVFTKDERIAKELGGGSEELDVEGPGKIKIIRARLESAMKAVIGDDDERSKPNREWSGWYGKWCGGDDEGPPTRMGDWSIGMSVEEYHRTLNKVET